MNRTIPLLISALLFAACDEKMKTTDGTQRPNRPSLAALNDPPDNTGTNGRDRLNALTPTERGNALNDPSTMQPVEPDNTATNARDRQDTLTPTDQGNSSAETKITAEIRKGLMAESSLSFTAKNAKVVTIGSHVTLRGPVLSTDEKSLIAAVAMRTSGVSDVDNQLEVKP